MVRLAVCDDEAAARETLCAMADAFLSARELGHHITPYANGGELLAAGEFDVIFLDIRMRGMSGMETARKLRAQGREGLLVFVTALEEYACDAFDVEALGYLVKPLDAGRFSRTMERVCKALWQREQGGLLIKRAGGCRRVRFSEIVYCEIMSRKIYLHTGREVIDYYQRLAALETQIDGRFFKCHRSYLVNLDHVQGFTEGMARLDTGAVIPVSRLRRQEFSQALLRRLRGESP